MASPTTPDLLIARLGSGVASSSELEHALRQSQSQVSRTLRKLTAEEKVLRMGARRGARYGLRRAVADIGSQWPLRRIDADGAIHDLGSLHALAADQYFFEPAKQARFAGGGLSNGLPYFLQDQRPAGFLGRAVPRRYPELNLPQRTVDWTDDHYLRYLTRQGSDAIGDLILGNEAFDRYLADKPSASPLPVSRRNNHYPQLAQDVMQGGLPGSSAHGEHPKFTAVLQQRSGPCHMLVKFSPPMKTPTGQRWADLLIAEYHAHRALRDAGIDACLSEALVIEDRVYLQVERFDRSGLHGRIGVTSLWAIDTAFYGQLDNWTDAAARLHRDRRIDTPTLERIQLLATFGALIANTDRHFGNLTFYDRYDGRLQLAPVYDMLPMLFAPEHDQIVARTFTPQRATSSTLRVWPRACELAQQYWEALSDDTRISSAFRSIAAASLKALRELARSSTG